MAWELLLILISGLISDTKGETCKSNQTPVIQVCKDGSVSGTSVYIENTKTPTVAVNCTCNVDLGGGTVSNVEYSGPGYSSCGLQFILGENGASFSCYSNTLSNTHSFSAIHFSRTAVPSGYACLSIRKNAGPNITITCHAPLTSTPSMTTSRTSPSGSSSRTSHSTSMTISTSSSETTETTESHSTPKSKRQNISTSTEETPNSNEGLSKITLIGIAAGGGGAILIILVIVVVCCIRKRKGASESDVIITENEVYGSKLSQNNSRLSSPPYTNQSYEIQPEDVPSTVTKTVDQKEPLGRQHTIPDVSDDSAYSEIGELSTVNDRVKVVDDDDQLASDDISSMYSVVNKHKQKQTEEDTVADEQHVTTTSRVNAHGTGDYYAVVLKPGKHQN